MFMTLLSCQKEEKELTKLNDSLAKMGINSSDLTEQELSEIESSLKQDKQKLIDEMNQELKLYGITPLQFWETPIDVDALNLRMDTARDEQASTTFHKATPSQCNRAFISYVRTFAPQTATLSGLDLLILRRLNLELSGHPAFATRNAYVASGLSYSNASSITGINFQTSIVFTTSDYNILNDAIVNNCN